MCFGHSRSDEQLERDHYGDRFLDEPEPEKWVDHCVGKRCDECPLDPCPYMEEDEKEEPPVLQHETAPKQNHKANVIMRLTSSPDPYKLMSPIPPSLDPEEILKYVCVMNKVKVYWSGE